MLQCRAFLSHWQHIWRENTESHSKYDTGKYKGKSLIFWGINIKCQTKLTFQSLQFHLLIAAACRLPPQSGGSGRSYPGIVRGGACLRASPAKAQTEGYSGHRKQLGHFYSTPQLKKIDMNNLLTEKSRDYLTRQITFLSSNQSFYCRNSCYVYSLFTLRTLKKMLPNGKITHNPHHPGAVTSELEFCSNIFLSFT